MRISISFFKRRLSVFAVALLSASILLGCTSSPKSSEKVLKSDPAIVQGTLSNGMDYYVRRNSEPKNRIELRLVVKAGSNMEDDDQKGIAHLIEHMCFNGTENFEKNEIINFFEEIGMNFGADLNAYTSWDETVYMIQIPADNPEHLQKALLVLHDWASAVTFDTTEIDKERGVVNEEWRMRDKGLSGRISNNLVDFALSGSRYAKRLPIGDINIVRTIKRERIVDFYKKWYRPELMSVVVVGDTDTAKVVSSIKEIMGAIPASEEKKVSPEFEGPNHTQKKVFTMRDSEQPYILTQIMHFDKSYEPSTTEATFKRNLERDIVGFIINQRLGEITSKPDAPWLAANVTAEKITKEGMLTGFAFVPKGNMYETSLKTLFDEYDRVNLFGFTQSELDYAKTVFTSEIEESYKTLLTYSSAARASEIVNQILDNGTALADSEWHKQSVAALNAITVASLNETFAQIFPERGMLCFNIYPSGAKDTISDAKVRDIWSNYHNDSITAYADQTADGELMSPITAKADIASQRTVKEMGCTEYVLSNGARIYLKKTDFDKNQISFRASSKGGSILVKDSDYPSLIAALDATVLSGMNGLDYNQVKKVLNSKHCSISLNISTNEENITGYSTPVDMETLLQMVYLMMTKPQFTDDGWSLTLQNYETLAQGFNLEPLDVFINKAQEMMYTNRAAVRYEGISPAFVKAISPSRGESLLKSRFSNAADWSFIFVGDFDEKKLLDLCRAYIGAIPGDKNKTEDYVDSGWGFAKQSAPVVVKKGSDEQGAVGVIFGTSNPAGKSAEENWKEAAVLSQLQSLLEIRLREAIREDKSGAYALNTSANIFGNKTKLFRSTVIFTCEPSRSDELADEVLEQIKLIQTTAVDQKYVDKVNEAYRRSRETNLRSNSWWVSKIDSILAMENEPMTEVTDANVIPSLTTVESMQQYAKKYYDTSKCIKVFLKPEK
jgi:zinc protease